MAKLEFYRQQTLPRNASNPNIGAVGRIGQGMVRAADLAADAARTMGQVAERRREDEAAIDAAARLSDARRYWMERGQQLQNEAREKGELDGFAGRLSTEFEEYAAEQLKGAKTPRAQAYLTERFGSMGVDLFGRSMEFEAQAKIERDSALVDQTLENSRVILDMDPTQYDAVREDLQLQFSRLPAGPKREQAWRKAEGMLAYQASLSAARAQPGAVLEALDSGEGPAFMAALSADDRMRVRSFAETEIRQREAEAEKAKVDARNASVNAIYDMLDQNGGDMQQVILAMPQAVDALDGEDRARLNQYAGMVATGGTILTDWQAYGALINDPVLLKNTDLGAIRDQFNSREFSQLQTLQQALIEDPGVEQNVVTTSAMIGRMLDEAGVGKSEKRQARFYAVLQDAIDQQLIVSGKKNLTQREIKELAEDLLVDQVVSRGMIPLFDDEEIAFEIEVPAEARAAIEQTLTEQGLPVTDYNVLQTYRRSLPQ